MNVSDTHDSSIDYFLVQQFLDLIKEGELEKIVAFQEKYHLDAKNIKDRNLEQNPVFYCTEIRDEAKSIEVLKYFAEKGVNMAYKDKLKQTALYYTSKDGKLEVSRYFIEKGLPLNEKDEYGQTPVFYAAREGHVEILNLMMEHGLDVNVIDSKKQTCIFYSIEKGRYDFIVGLIKAGAELNLIDKKRQTPLSLARKMGRSDIVELLIENGAEDNKGKKKQPMPPKKVEEPEVPQVTDYVIVKYLDKENRAELDQEGLKEFLRQNPELTALLLDESKIAELDEKTPEELKTAPYWEKAARKVMNQTWKHPKAHIFHKPVNPVELAIYDYFDKIKNPMDFSTIKKKLNSSIYVNCQEFVDDMNLTFDNCFLYNGRQSQVGEMCADVQIEFERQRREQGLNKYV